MSAKHVGYIVAEINPDSGEAKDTLPSQVLHFNWEDAAFERDLTADDAHEMPPGRYAVCEVAEVRDDATEADALDRIAELLPSALMTPEVLEIARIVAATGRETGR